MKKTFSSKTLFNMGLFGLCAMVAFVALTSVLFATRLDQSNVIQKYLYVSLFGISLLLLFAYSFLLNRIGCVVWFDDKADELCRKGLFFGFNYRLKRSHIKDVIIATIPKQTKFYVIMDEENHSPEGISKKSFIRLEYNSKNRDFIKKFWNKPLE